MRFIQLTVYFMVVIILKTVEIKCWRYVNAHSIPTKDVYLDTPPLHQQLATAIKCVELCTHNVKCFAINYHENTTCQLLATYLCSGTAILKAENGFTYFDVDFGRSIQEMNEYIASDECKNNNRCSPRCKNCVLGTNYINGDKGYITGANLDFKTGLTLVQCQSYCNSNSSCRAIEHFDFSQFCYLSQYTRDMVHPDEFKYNDVSYYMERECL